MEVADAIAICQHFLVTHSVVVDVDVNHSTTVDVAYSVAEADALGLLLY